MKIINIFLSLNPLYQSKLIISYSLTLFYRNGDYEETVKSILYSAFDNTHEVLWLFVGGYLSQLRVPHISIYSIIHYNITVIIRNNAIRHYEVLI